MDGGSPSRHQEKRSKKNQDRAAVPKPSGRTKATCKHGGAGGSCATRHRDDHGPSATVPPPAPAPIGDVPMVDEEEEALDHAGARHGSESCWWMDSSSASGLSSLG